MLLVSFDSFRFLGPLFHDLVEQLLPANPAGSADVLAKNSVPSLAPLRRREPPDLRPAPRFPVATTTKSRAVVRLKVHEVNPPRVARASNENSEHAVIREDFQRVVH